MVVMRRRVQGDEEAALGRHDFKRLAGLQAGMDPVGKSAAPDLAHADAQFAIVNAGAYRVGTAHLLAVQLGAQRQVLALGEAEHAAQGIGHVKRHDHGFGGVGCDRAHAQGMKGDAHGAALTEV